LVLETLGVTLEAHLAEAVVVEALARLAVLHPQGLVKAQMVVRVGRLYILHLTLLTLVPSVLLPP
jgi:hypothetical protein